MSCIFYCYLPVQLALSKTVQDMLFLSVLKYRQISLKSTSIKRLPCEKFLAYQGLYLSSFIKELMVHDTHLNQNNSQKLSDLILTINLNERTFVRLNDSSDGTELLLNNIQALSVPLTTQITNINQSHVTIPWMFWTNDQGYWYFQPTAIALKAWLNMLFIRRKALKLDRLELDKIVWQSSCLGYIEQRCRQLEKLVGREIMPWEQAELSCEAPAELELIYALIAVYDSLDLGQNYQIVAAGKSLVEKFLAFDRHCRLGDLPFHSPRFQARAGLIMVVRSAVRDLMASNFGKIENHRPPGDKS